MKRSMKVWMGLVVLAWSVGCGHPGSQGATNPEVEPPEAQQQPMQFNQLVDGATSVEDCRAANQGSVFNCEHVLLLCPNGGFTLLLTDIMNEGRFSRDGQQVEAELEGGGDGPGRFSATLDAQESSLTSPQLGGEHRWLRQLLDAPARQQAVQSCQAIEGRTWWPQR